MRIDSLLFRTLFILSGFGLSQQIKKNIVGNVPESPVDVHAKSKHSFTLDSMSPKNNQSVLSESPIKLNSADDSINPGYDFNDPIAPTIPIDKSPVKKGEESGSCSTDGDQYASTAPMEDSVAQSSPKRRRGTIERAIQQLADTVPVEQESLPQEGMIFILI